MGTNHLFLAGLLSLNAIGASAMASGLGDEWIAPNAAIEDVRLARRALETIHPGYDRFASREALDAAFGALERDAADGMTERDMFARLSLVLASIRCSHTKAEPPAGWNEFRAETPTYLPFRFELDADSAMVVTASGDDSIAPGDVILSIDGVPAPTIVGTLLPAVPADGWTDNARRFSLGASSDLDDCEFDLFYPVFFPIGERAAIELRGTDEPRTRLVHVQYLAKSAQRAAIGEPAAPSNLDEAVSLSFPTPDVALLEVGTFVAYRKQIDPEDVYRPLFEAIREQSPATLIVDLRSNGGGSDEAALDLTRFLSSEPFATGTHRSRVRTYRFGDLREHLSTWDESVFELPDDIFTPTGDGFFEIAGQPATHDPLEPAFTGDVIILSGPANQSGATLFISEMAARDHVAVVGEPTGGSVEGPTAGVILFLTLPNSGMKVRIPALRSVTGRAPAEPGAGVTPDVIVRTTPTDRLAGRDPVLEEALRMARRSP